MKKCIVFDIDGTLFDTKEGILSALNEVIVEYGGRRINEDEQNKYIGPSVRDSLNKFQGFKAKKLSDATNRYRELYVAKYVALAEPYPYMLDVLKRLRDGGYVLAIATMKTEKQVFKILQQFSITDYFDIIQYADDKGKKTKTDMLNTIANSIIAKHYYMVGDTLGDYIAATDAGYKFVFAEYGYGEVAKYNYSIHNIKELISIMCKE